MAHCNSPTACREQKELLEAQSEVVTAATQLVDTLGELSEAHARRVGTSAKYQIAHAERKCVEKTLDEEARARVEATYAKERAREEVGLAEVQAELAETRLRKERAENALADLAESR